MMIFLTRNVLVSLNRSLVYMKITAPNITIQPIYVWRNIEARSPNLFAVEKH